MTATEVALFVGALACAFAGSRVAAAQNSSRSAPHFDPARVTGPMVHLHGAARIDARASRSGGDLVLSGTLTDDAGEPLASEAVLVEIARGASAQSVRFEGDATPRECGDKSGGHLQVDDARTVVAKADEAGRFCVRVTLPVDRYAAHLTSKASDLLDAAKADVAIDLGARSLLLRFDPPPRVVSLDQDAAVLDAVAIVDDEGAAAAGSNLLLTLTNEAGAQLGSATTNGSGRARFAIDPTRLGPPGAGELHLAFAGDGATSHAEHVASIERHARVHLELAKELHAASPEDGLPLSVRATTRVGEVPSGAVEARLDEAPVGAGSVEHGTADVIASFVAPASALQSGSVHLELAYLPEAPWFEPGDALSVDAPVKGPSPWRQLPLLATAIALAAFLALGRTSGKRRTETVPPADQGRAPGPHVSVVRAAPSPHAGWSGRVIDAHDAGPVRGARVAIDVPGFTSSARAAVAETDEQGRFSLPGQSGALPGAELVVDAKLHATLKRPLPPAGELSIALVSRRRALLDRLVEWARARGKPYDAKPEPTPSHVRQVAGEAGEVARWADAVERVAFGPDDVDARAEGDVERIKPTPR